MQLGASGTWRGSGPLGNRVPDFQSPGLRNSRLTEFQGLGLRESIRADLHTARHGTARGAQALSARGYKVTDFRSQELWGFQTPESVRAVRWTFSWTRWAPGPLCNRVTESGSPGLPDFHTTASVCPI